jgi:NAD+ synthase (glutamine-hydrolysing)
MKIACLQLNSTVGDFAGNRDRLATAYLKAVQKGAELVLAPELFLCGYPPRDLLNYPSFYQAHEAALAGVATQVGPVPLITGALQVNPHRPGKAYFNAAVVLADGKIKQVVHKTLLPTYDVFDEDRYFQPGEGSEPFLYKGKRIGITVCEDIWNDEDYWPERLYRRDPVKELAAKGIDLLVNVSASPWHQGKEQVRRDMLRRTALDEKVPVIQVNLVGGNDELVFDGESVAVSAEGVVLAAGKSFEEDLFLVDPFQPAAGAPRTWPCEEAQLFSALALGVRDYVRKCGFEKVVIGLSGGIDSAVTAVIAVEALGPDNVIGVLMPTGYSSQGSIDDAQKLADILEIESFLLPIQQTFDTALGHLAPVLAGTVPDTTEENVQSRLRGLTLMAIANKRRGLVLTTGNKSELAVGYCTLYGDMCGGLAVISDLPKTTVYRLSRWINRISEIIPAASITKAPSAELRPDQKDQDSLPPYEILDRILEAYVVENKAPDAIVALGIDRLVVDDIVRKIDLNEYKRRQAAPGLKVTTKAFGVGRRMPVAQRFRHQL